MWHKAEREVGKIGRDWLSQTIHSLQFSHSQQKHIPLQRILHLPKYLIQSNQQKRHDANISGYVSILFFLFFLYQNTKKTMHHVITGVGVDLNKENEKQPNI